TFAWVFTISQANGPGVFIDQSETIPAGDFPYSICAADFDKDGYNDFVVANFISDNIYVRLNSGDGTFDSPLEISVDKDPTSVIAADLDGDSYPDLAMVNRLTGTAFGTITVLLNNGDGSFSEQLKDSVHESPFCLTSADFDCDGDIDLAVGHLNGSIATYISILENIGDGTFAEPVKYLYLSSIFSIRADDINSDGAIDLIFADYYNDLIGVLPNNGDGSFGSINNTEVDELPNSLYCGDFDIDGDIDLAVVNSGSNNLVILTNNGDGYFPSHSIYSVGRVPSSVYGNDLDGDNDIDLVVTNENTDDISVMFNMGDGNFAVPITYPVGDKPAVIIICDFTGDNIPDLMIANKGSDDISLLVNKQPTDIPLEIGLPSEFELFQNYPNPFNPTTNIQFYLEKSDEIVLGIYNITGQKVITLIDKRLGTGLHKISWDGTDGFGNEVASGIYFYQLKTGDSKKSRKMILLK
ncbi:MAG: T9SS type A sorting domain-containing protein, partial [candidate division Zixibacteria bacterium]|nr:T9SS type A sorting domain-containing protein [candidate division Zixibacteria bacterium]